MTGYPQKWYRELLITFSNSFWRKTTMRRKFYCTLWWGPTSFSNPQPFLSRIYFCFFQNGLIAHNLIEKINCLRAYELIVSEYSSAEDKMSLSMVAAWCIIEKILSLSEVANLLQVRLGDFSIDIQTAITPIRHETFCMYFREVNFFRLFYLCSKNFIVNLDQRKSRMNLIPTLLTYWTSCQRMKEMNVG